MFITCAIKNSAWYKDGNHLPEGVIITREGITILSVQQNHTGKYTCYKTNTHIPNATAVLFVGGKYIFT